MNKSIVKFKNMSLKDKKEYIDSKKQIINNNLLYYNELYQKNYDYGHEYDTLFKEYIEMTKKQLMSYSLNMTNKEIEVTKIYEIYDNLTIVYIEIFNGIFRPLEAIGGSL